MIPVVTPEEMGAIDRAAPEPVEVLIERAGAAVARTALDVLGGTYGRRVVVVAGKGNNGADGRSAARRLERRGVRVTVFDAAACPSELPPCDLVIDAAYGTGFRGEYDAPVAANGDAFVLAVDVPSGLNGLTGEACRGAVQADATVTFAALKPGLLYNGGEHTGVITVVDIGLDVGGAHAQLVEPADLRGGAPRRPRDAHKYWSAVLVVGGSPGMTGAPTLCARAAFRAGSGYVRLGVPGLDPAALPATEAVGLDLRTDAWASTVLDACDRMKAVAIGPGLGRNDANLAEARRVIDEAPLPAVVDGDGLLAVADECKHERVLTPHEGEYSRLAGRPVGADRLADVREVARSRRATVLLKGPTTLVADRDGNARFVTTGGPALATAGSGDVLTGIVAAFLAGGTPALDAAALAACAHGIAARAAHRGEGLVAGDLVDVLPAVLWPER